MKIQFSVLLIIFPVSSEVCSLSSWMSQSSAVNAILDTRKGKYSHLSTPFEWLTTVSGTISLKGSSVISTPPCSHQPTSSASLSLSAWGDEVSQSHLPEAEGKSLPWDEWRRRRSDRRLWSRLSAPRHLLSPRTRCEGFARTSHNYTKCQNRFRTNYDRLSSSCCYRFQFFPLTKNRKSFFSVAFCEMLKKKTKWWKQTVITLNDHHGNNWNV